MASRRRHVASSGTPRVLSKCIGSIPATGATIFVVLIGAPYSSLSLLNWPRNFMNLAIIALIAVFTKALHWDLSLDCSVSVTLWLGQFSLRNSWIFYYLSILRETKNHGPVVRRPVSYFRGVFFVSQLGLKFFVFSTFLPSKLRYMLPTLQSFSMHFVS